VKIIYFKNLISERKKMKAFQKQTVKIRAIPGSGPRAPPFFSINNITFKVIRDCLIRFEYSIRSKYSEIKKIKKIKKSIFLCVLVSLWQQPNFHNFCNPDELQ